MSNITKEEVEHLAKLALLDLSEEDEEKFEPQLNEVLEFVEKISGVDTGTVTETNSPLKITRNVFREDIVEPSLTQEEALKNAPEKHNGYFKVKAIFENE